MYEVNLSDEARSTTGQLPHDAIKALAELVDLLTLQPYTGTHRPPNPPHTPEEAPQ